MQIETLVDTLKRSFAEALYDAATRDRQPVNPAIMYDPKNRCIYYGSALHVEVGDVVVWDLSEGLLEPATPRNVIDAKALAEIFWPEVAEKIGL